MNATAEVRKFPIDAMQTFSGRFLRPLEPDPGEIQLTDIAHALSNICRFGGHTREFYSVAQHSVLVSRRAAALAADSLGAAPLSFRLELGRNAATLGLLHDATEAYIGDAIWPLKRTSDWEAFRAVESRLELAVLERFGLARLADKESDVWDFVKQADAEVCLAEARDLMNDPAYVRQRLGNLEPWPLLEAIEPVGPAAARRMFLDEWVRIL